MKRLYRWSNKTRFYEQQLADPSGGVDKFKEHERVLSSSEVPGFFQALSKIHDVDLRDFVVLSLASAAKKTNILEMKWADLDLPGKLWRVPMSKNGKGYPVKLLPAGVDVLARRQETATSDYVFPGPGKTGHRINIRKGWKHFCEAAGLAGFRIHDIRRTVASAMIEEGVPAYVVSKALGHKRMSRVVETYINVADQSVERGRIAGEKHLRKLLHP